MSIEGQGDGAYPASAVGQDLRARSTLTVRFSLQEEAHKYLVSGFESLCRVQGQCSQKKNFFLTYYFENSEKPLEPINLTKLGF